MIPCLRVYLLTGVSLLLLLPPVTPCLAAHDPAPAPRPAPPWTNQSAARSRDPRLTNGRAGWWPLGRAQLCSTLGIRSNNSPTQLLIVWGLIRHDMELTRNGSKWGQKVWKFWIH